MQVAISVPLDDTAAILRALADPTRLAIAATLARETDALCVCHIEARFALSQPTISHHLKALRTARLVRTERRGTWIHYALDRDRVAQIPGLAALLASIETSRACDTKACCP
ncbi:MAG: metalloregulator ArsR/SmtB family transcription factor [Sandaracinus sp.]